jgi:hypothetical protein
MSNYKQQAEHWEQCFRELEHHDDVEIIALKLKIKKLEAELKEAKKPKLVCYYSNVKGELISKADYALLSREQKWEWKAWATTRAIFKARRIAI